MKDSQRPYIRDYKYEADFLEDMGKYIKSRQNIPESVTQKIYERYPDHLFDICCRDKREAAEFGYLLAVGEKN